MSAKQVKAAKKQAAQKLESRNRYLVGVFGGLMIAIVWSGLSVVADARHMRSLYHELGEVQQTYDRLLESNSRLIL